MCGGGGGEGGGPSGAEDWFLEGGGGGRLGWGRVVGPGDRVCGVDVGVSGGGGEWGQQVGRRVGCAVVESGSRLGEVEQV